MGSGEAHLGLPHGCLLLSLPAVFSNGAFFESAVNQNMGDTSFNGLITAASPTFASLLRFMAFDIKQVAEANDLLSKLYFGEGKAAVI